MFVQWYEISFSELLYRHHLGIQVVNMGYQDCLGYMSNSRVLTELLVVSSE